MKGVAGSWDWRCGGDLLEGGDEGVCAGEALFDGRGLEGGLVGGAARPDFRDPKDIFVGCVFGDDEAEAAGDRVGVIASHEVDEFGAASGGGGEFYDETVHGVIFSRVYACRW